MEAPNALYAATFDNVRFDGPESDAVLGPQFATYTSANDSLSGSSDVDGDTVPDDYETETGQYVSPWNTGTSPTAADSDGDGQTDGGELVAGTNPNDRTDFLAFRGIERVPEGGVLLLWWARAAKTYQVQFRDGLTEPGTEWTPLAGAQALRFIADGQAGIVDRTGDASSFRCYQLVVLPSSTHNGPLESRGD
jgi:hypothetical protein